MTIRRASKPEQRRLEGNRSFVAKTDYGPCEHHDCERQARATCTDCGGEYCLWHERHMGHDRASATD